MYKELFNLPCSKSSFDQVNGLLLFEIFTCFVLHMMVFQFSAELATICNSPHRNLMEKAVGCCGPLAPLDSWFIWSSLQKVIQCSFERFHFRIFPQFWQKFSITQSVKNVPKLWQIYTYVRYIQSICLYALPTAKTSFALGIWLPMPKFGYSPCAY